MTADRASVRRLHRLALAGRDCSPEADAVRDAIDAPWRRLDEGGREAARAFSERLWRAAEGGPAAGP